MTIEYYIDTCSSWVHFARETIARLRVAYGDRAEITWRIALLDRSDAMGHTCESMDWYYRRSHALTGEKLNAAWIVDERTGSTEANLVVEAARELGVGDDRAWLAVAGATMGEGRQIASFAGAANIVARACDLDADRLVELARSAATRERVDSSTRRFHELGLRQRPAFVLRNEIDDEVRFSGLIAYDPLASAIECMLADSAGYAAYARANGAGP